MVDFNDDMFKPLIGARLIREDWERRQAELNGTKASQTVGEKPSGMVRDVVAIPATEAEALGLRNTAAIPGAGIETPTHISNGASKEIK